MEQEAGGDAWSATCYIITFIGMFYQVEVTP